LITFCTCTEKKVKDKKTEIFSKYLFQQFHTDIPNELHYFILVPKMGCKGCMHKTLIELSKLINKENSKKFTFISTNDDVIPDELIIKIKLLHDEAKLLDNLNLDIANITIVETLEHKVNYIKPIYEDQISSLTNIIK